MTTDSRQKFEPYCNYVIDLKESRGGKHSTIVRYRELTERIYPAIGHIKLKDLRADHLNNLYTQLSHPGAGKSHPRAVAKIDLAKLLVEKHITRASIAKQSGLAVNVVSAAVAGREVSPKAAEGITKALGLNFDKVFTINEHTRTLAPKTVLEYHRLISSVLAQAEKESLVPFNVAAKATLPKVTKKEINYFQPEQITTITP